jgi:predicted kinase
MIPQSQAIGRVRLLMVQTDGLIVVAGLPGSGKTTLALRLAPVLGIPLISKDTIKEALFDALGTGDLEWSQRLGRASHQVMYALASRMHPVMLESHFWAGVAEPELLALGRPLLQIYCSCPTEVAVDRYRERARSEYRHPGHLPEHQSDEVIESWRSRGPETLALGCQLLEVDTTGPVDIEALAEKVRESWTEATSDYGHS